MGNRSQNSKDEAFDVVFDLLGEIMCKPKDQLRCQLDLSDRFVKDLRIDSDDLSFVFIPKLEEWVGTEIPQEDWDKVWTLQDAVNLAARLRRKE